MSTYTSRAIVAIGGEGMNSILPLLIICGVGIVASATYIVMILARYYVRNRHNVEYYQLLEDGTLVVCNNYRRFIDE